MPRQADAPSARKKKRPPKEDVRLTGDRIVVRNPDDGERQTRGGLLIPATAIPAPKRCLWSSVVLVGPDVRAVKADRKSTRLNSRHVRISYAVFSLQKNT